MKNLWPREKHWITQLCGVEMALTWALRALPFNRTAGFSFMALDLIASAGLRPDRWRDSTQMEPSIRTSPSAETIQ